MNKPIITLLIILMISGCIISEEYSDNTMKESVEIRGFVMGGGDQTIEGQLDVPREFIYQVNLDSGEEINVKYIAFPPSPTSNKHMGPKLNFSEGVISIGDRIIARGTFDQDSDTLYVEDEDDFIKTYSPSVEIERLLEGEVTISGTVIGGGDQTAEGLLDGPREFIYQVKLDSGEEINVKYIALPPSPVSDNQTGPELDFLNGKITPGDQMIARGTFDPDLNTLLVETETDFIKTTSD